jgi:hypothetical protein
MPVKYALDRATNYFQKADVVIDFCLGTMSLIINEAVSIYKTLPYTSPWAYIVRIYLTSCKKMKNKKYHTVVTVPTSNPCSSVKSGGVKLVL